MFFILAIALTFIVVEVGDRIVDRLILNVTSNYNVAWATRLRNVHRIAWGGGTCILLTLVAIWCVAIYHTF